MRDEKELRERLKGWLDAQKKTRDEYETTRAHLLSLDDRLPSGVRRRVYDAMQQYYQQEFREQDTHIEHLRWTLGDL